MATGRFGLLRDLLRQRVTRWGGAVVLALGGYDAASSQFDLPKLRQAIPWLAKSMNEMLMPWWGWLLILEAVFVYALFEYIFRNVASPVALGDGKVDFAFLAKMEAVKAKKKLMPDITLQALGLRVVDTYEVPKDDQQKLAHYRKATLEIADKIKLHGATAWGRRGDRPLEKIDGYDWGYGTLEIAKGQLEIPGEWGIVTVDDVQFASEEIDHIWPPPKEDENRGK